MKTDYIYSVIGTKDCGASTSVANSYGLIKNASSKDEATGVATRAFMESNPEHAICLIGIRAIEAK